MKVLVTGGAGFIGSNLSAFLINKGAKVTILDDFSQGVMENIKHLKADLIKGRVEDEALINSLTDKGFDCIFHQAALTDTTIDSLEKMMEVNVDGFKNILNLAVKEKARVVYASSAGTYGRGPVPMKESQELFPLNAYARSKVKMDEMAQDFARETNLNIIGLRYFNVYGPGEQDKGKSASMIGQLADQMKAGKNPRIFKYGQQKRDFIYVKDVVAANIKAMEWTQNKIPNGLSQNKSTEEKHIDTETQKSKVYFKTTSNFMIANVGTGQMTSFNRIIEILNKTLNTNYDPEYFDNPYGFCQDYTQADTNLAEQVLGFKARFNIEEGIKDYLKG